MAYIAQQQNDEEQEGEGAPGGQLTPQVGGSPSAPAAPKSGPGFTGISAYLQKNRPAVQRLAQRVTDRANQLGTTARDAIQTGATGFQQDVERNTTNLDADTIGRIKTDATGLANSPEQLARVQQARDAQYGGPKAIEETPYYDAISQAMQAANTTRDSLGTKGGLQNLVRQVERGPTVSRGRVLLDSALLGANPDSRAALNAAKANLGGLSGEFGTASSAAQAQAAQGRAATDASRTGVQSALGEATTTAQANIEAQLQRARTDAAARTAANNAALNSNADLSDQQLADLGLTREYWDNVRGVEGSKVSEAMRRLSKKARAGAEQHVKKDVFVDRYRKNFAEGRENMSRPDFVTQTGVADAITREQAASQSDLDLQMALNALRGQEDNYLNPLMAGELGTAPVELSDANRVGISDFAQRLAERNAKKSADQIAINARSGGDSFLKKHGASIATGGLVPSGGKLTDIGKAMLNPLDAGKELLSGADSGAIFSDPAGMFHDNPAAKERTRQKQLKKLADIAKLTKLNPELISDPAEVSIAPVKR